MGALERAAVRLLRVVAVVAFGMSLMGMLVAMILATNKLLTAPAQRGIGPWIDWYLMILKDGGVPLLLAGILFVACQLALSRPQPPAPPPADDE